MKTNGIKRHVNGNRLLVARFVGLASCAYNNPPASRRFPPGFQGRVGLRNFPDEVAMPAKRRELKRTFTVELPEEIAQRLEDLLAQTRRSPSAEIALAVEFWLERQGMGESAVEPESKPSRRPPP